MPVCNIISIIIDRYWTFSPLASHLYNERNCSWTCVIITAMLLALAVTFTIFHTDLSTFPRPDRYVHTRHFQTESFSQGDKVMSVAGSEDKPLLSSRSSRQNLYLLSQHTQKCSNLQLQVCVPAQPQEDTELWCRAIRPGSHPKMGLRSGHCKEPVKSFFSKLRKNHLFFGLIFF